MINEITQDLESGYKKTVESLKRDLMKMRTGRANVAILDGIKVIYYGSPTPLNQVAALSVPDPRLIVVKPYDKSLLGALEKAIIAADVGITPSNDGEIIRLPVPALSGERRKELSKMVKKQGEDAKIALRNQRRDANELLKELTDLPEDDVERGLKKVQELTDHYVKVIDTEVERKEKEVLEV